MVLYTGKHHSSCLIPHLSPFCLSLPQTKNEIVSRLSTNNVLDLLLHIHNTGFGIILDGLSGGGCFAFSAVTVVEDTCDLNDTNTAEEEVYCCQAEIYWLVSGSTKGVAGEKTYRTFLGLMIKHQRVQIAPVQVRAKF